MLWTLLLAGLGNIYAVSLNAFVIECTDGINCTVNLLGLDAKTPTVFTDEIAVRLYDIEVPYVRGNCMLEKCLAEKALKFTQDRVENKEVTIEILGRDKSFRLLVDLKYKEFGIEVSLRQKLINTYYGVESYVDMKTVTWCDFSDEQFFYWHAHDCLIEDLCVLREYDTGKVIHNRSEC